MHYPCFVYFTVVLSTLCVILVHLQSKLQKFTYLLNHGYLYVTAWELMKKISWNWIMEGFAKIWQHGPVWLKSNSSNAILHLKKKIKSTLEQAIKTQRGSRGIAILFGARYNWVVNVMPWLLNPTGKIPSTLCTGGWVSPRAGPDRCGKSRCRRDSTTRPSSP